MAKLLLPYAYTVEGVPYRGRKLRQAAVVDRAEFDIPEASREDAPIVLKWSLGTSSGTDALMKSRWFSGKLYRPVSHGMIAYFSKEMFERALEGKVQDGGLAAVRDFRLSNLTCVPLSAARRIGSYFPVKEDALAAVTGRSGAPRLLAADDDRCLQEAEGAYKETLLLLDGEVWTSMRAEPTWRVDLEFVQPEPTVPLGTLPVKRNVLQFRADRLDVALAAAREFDPCAEKPPRFADGHVEVLMPELLGNEAVLLCESLFKAVNYWSSWAAPEASASAIWRRCSPDVQALGQKLCGLTNSERPKREDALEALDVAARLVGAFGTMDLQKVELDRLRACLLPTVWSYSVMDVIGTGLSDEEEAQIASVFDQ